MKDVKIHIIQKLFSARYFATMIIIATYCVVIFTSIFLVVVDKLAVDVFLGLFSGFSLLAGKVIESYFNIKREGENEKINTDGPIN